MMSENINSWLNQKEIAFQVNDVMLIGGMFSFVILLFFFMAIRQHSKAHKRGLTMKHSLTAETKGVVVKITQSSYVLDGESRTDYYAHAKFMGDYEAKTTPILMQTYKYKVGDEVDIIYNPQNPSENAFKQDMLDGIKQKGYQGVFDVLKLIFIFIIGVFLILLFTGGLQQIIVDLF
ncbi:MAG: DUF3592 domain-containing protein [Lachnospiraceae bacterium]|nr:DUF3592 domain-containing protein [Lachnospiraceae bacterium]